MPKLRLRRGRYIERIALACTLAAPLLTAWPAHGEIIPAAEMVRGISMTPQQCALRSPSIWVNFRQGGFCIRYYVSNAGGDGPFASVYLQGDKLGKFDKNTGTYDRARDVDTRNLEKSAARISKETRGPAIYLARPGIDGSSGNHRHRGSELELLILNAALDGIKQRHQFRGFHLAGQSRGAGMVGALLGVRRDIGCAVPGSGSLSYSRILPKEDPVLRLYDASARAQSVARNGARILVITDPEDKITGLNQQTRFVERVRSAGAAVEHYFVRATDEKRHGTMAYQIIALGGCVRGEPKSMIAQSLAEEVRTRLAAASAKQRKLQQQLH
jgi:hypothetical protein